MQAQTPVLDQDFDDPDEEEKILIEIKKICLQGPKFVI